MTIFKEISLIHILIGVGFAMGVIVDRFFRNLWFFQWDQKINLVDLAQLIATIVLAIFIPIYLNKLIEDQKGVKSLLIEEMKDLHDLYKKIKKVVSDSYSNGIFTEVQRNELRDAFDIVDLKVGSLIEQISIAYPAKGEDCKTKLTKVVFDYERSVTGGILMAQSFDKIEDEFYWNHEKEYSKLNTNLKKFSQEIYKL